MKILYHFRTQGTGAEGVHIAGIAGAFERLGHSVVFSSPGGTDPRPTAGESPFRSPGKRGLLSRLAAQAPGLVFELLEIAYNLAALLRHRTLLARERFDMIYERHAFFLCSTAWLAQRRDIPLVVEVNELAGDERVRATPWLAPLARLADRFTFARARLIVVVSPHLKRRIEALGIAPEKVLMLPNAVSEEMLEAADDGADVRARYGCEQALVVGFVAWHRLDALLGQFSRLARGDAALRLMLVGEGVLLETLQTQAEQLGIREQVIFTGPVPHREVAAHIAAMDIGVLPHSNEFRSPIKLFEFMARGRAIVAPRTEPIALVLRHRENALLFEPGNFDDLGDQLAVLLGDSELRKKLGTCARADVRERYTWTRNAEAVFAALRLADT
jgi:glycosyltransferase involved in cell wall biosynthesis